MHHSWRTRLACERKPKPHASRVRHEAVGLLLVVFLGLGSPVAAPAQDAKAQAAVRDFNTAAALQNQGLYDQALRKWMAFLGEYPADARLDRVYYYLGICQLHTKKYAEAAATFESVLKKYPRFEQAEGAQYNLGMARYQAAVDSKRRESYQLAAEALGAVATKFPQGKHAAAALYYQGESLLAAGDPRGATEAWKKITGQYAASPLAADAWYAVGTTQQEQGQDSEAILTFQRFLANSALARHELAAEVRLRLGLSLFKQRKYVEAEPHFTAAAAIAGFPNADLALLRQAQCRLLAGKSLEAAALFAELSKKFPKSVYSSEAQLAAGKAYFTAGKWAEARQALDPLVKGPGKESAEAACWLARALVKLSRPQEALSAIEIAMRNAPAGEMAAYLELARADALYDLSGRKGEAAAAYEKFGAQHPDHPLAGPSLWLAASVAFDEKEYPAARRRAEAFLGNRRLANHELAPGVLCLAAEACLAQTGGEVAKAESYYRQVVDRFPKSGPVAQAGYRLGEIAARQKKYDEAIARYKQCLEHSPQGEFAPRALYGLAAASFAKAEYSGAMTALERLLKGNPEASLATRARYLRGLVFQRQKQVDAAVKDLEAFLATRPGAAEAAEAQYALALCRIAAKQFDQASGSLSALLATKPDYPQADRAYYELGHALLRENRAEEAAAAFKTLGERLPASPLAAEGWFHVGRRYEDAADQAAAEAGKSAAAAKAAESYAAALARAKDPEFREKLQYKLADMQFRQKQFDQAGGTLQAQLREFPEGSLAGPARFLAAECLFRRDKFDDALPLFMRVVEDKIEKYRALALYRAGTCAANQKKWPESQKFFETLLRDFPEFEQIHDGRYGVARALQAQGRTGEARPIFEQIIKATDGEAAAKARFMLGEIAFADRKFEDAIEHYLTVVTGYPYKHWQALAQFEIGRSFLSLGKRQQALEAFQAVVDKYADHPKAQDAARMLGELK